METQENQTPQPSAPLEQTSDTPPAEEESTESVRHRVRFLRLTKRGWPLLLILAFSLGIRLCHLATFPANLSCDEGDNLREIYQIIEKGTPPLFGLDWKPQPAMSQHLAACTVRILGVDSGDYVGRFREATSPTDRREILDAWRADLAGLSDVLALRLNSAVFSVIALAFFFLLARRTVSPAAALAATLLLAVNPAFLNFSRSGWENVHISLATFLAVWGIVRLVERRGPWVLNIAVAALGTAWGLYGYFSGRAVPLILAVGVLAHFILMPPGTRPRSKSMRRLTAAGRWLTFWGLLAGPVAVAIPVWLLLSDRCPTTWLPLAILLVAVLWSLTLPWYRRLSQDIWNAGCPRRGMRLALCIGATAILSIALFIPQVKVIKNDWGRFTGRMRTVSAMHVPMPSDGFDTRAKMIRTLTWRTLQSPLRPINNRLRYAPGQKPLLQPVLGFLLIVGLLASLPRFGRHLWWWIMLIVPFIVTQMMTRGTPDVARGVALIPPLYYFVAVGLDRFRPLWHPSRRIRIPVFLILFALAAALWDVSLYREWTANPRTLGQRHPDVRLDEFPEWVQWQYLSLATNNHTKNIGEWRHLRDQHAASDLVQREARVPVAPPPDR